ncbi:hypothetical protein [Metabacillus halosaccharovorans]|uniref:hypothetical protein n=1 Tax=Metabacillus halosaccharovorans TaxID=930124 RepID=UPI00203B47C4|nr:hypothetical protein [Metabacillus halosaccharovorans]MCM3444735.1 hypothetical protein [Metabacillus halosaccharovorans]
MKNLPMGKAVINVHSHHAFAFSIMTDEISLPWIYSNYINIHAFPSIENGDFIHFCTSSRFQDVPYIFLSRLHHSQVKRWFSDILEFIIDSINNEYYINTVVDEFYITGTKAYQKYHFTHNVLVHGYNSNTKTIKIAGFFSDPPQYSFNKDIDYEEFKLAFKYSKPINNALNSTVELIKYPYFESPNNHFYKLDKKIVIESIENFLNSKKVPRIMVPSVNINYEAVYGLQVYALLEDYLLKGKKIHMKAFQTLLNHKYIMLLRIKYMIENGYIEDIKVFTLYKKVSSEMEIIHNLRLKYLIIKDVTVNDVIAKRLRNMASIEKEALLLLKKEINFS